jgi:hypothetical protein
MVELSPEQWRTLRTINMTDVTTIVVEPSPSGLGSVMITFYSSQGSNTVEITKEGRKHNVGGRY